MRYRFRPYLRLLFVLSLGAGITELAAQPEKAKPAKQIERPARIMLAATAWAHEASDQCLLMQPQSEPAPDDSAQRQPKAKPNKKIHACG